MSTSESIMSIHVLGPDEGYQWVAPNDAEGQSLTGLGESALKETWTPLEVKLVSPDEGHSLKTADLPWANHEVIVMRGHVVPLISSLISGCAELLPLDCDGERLFLLHVFAVLDALDEQKSRVVRFPSTGRIMEIEQYVFHSAAVRGTHFFKIPQLKSSAVFCSGDVVQSFDTNRLTGSKPNLVWAS